ncbi:MAG: hypothetical protein AB1513_11880 [Pseudomonadota bacterium]
MQLAFRHHRTNTFNIDGNYMIGKKNMVFGFAYFITTLLLGIYMVVMEENPGFEGSEAEEMMRVAHAHGNLESVLNIIIGYLLCRLAIGSGLAQTISILLLVGAVFHSGMIYLGSMGFEAAMKLAPIGALSLVAVMVLMTYAVATTREIK